MKRILVSLYLLFFLALSALAQGRLPLHHVSATMHIYPSGGHGWGWQDSMIYKQSWVSDMEDWLRIVVGKL